MGLDYLNKKTWHTASIKNIAKVWEREQKELRKIQKEDEYKKKLTEEQHAHELKIAQVEAGLIPKSALEKMDWMYNPVLGQQQQNTEQYLLGKPVDMSNLPQPNSEGAQDPQDNSNKYQAIVTEDVTNSTCENFTLIHEDPLFKIMQEEQKMKEKLMNNPLDMNLLMEEIRRERKLHKGIDDSSKKSKKKKDKKEKKSKKDKKHRNKEEKESKKSKNKSRSRSRSSRRSKKEKDQNKKHHKKDKSKKSRSSSSSSVSNQRSSSSLSTDSKQKLRKRSRSRSEKQSNKRSNRSPSPESKIKQMHYEEYLKKKVGNILVKGEDGVARPDFSLMKRKFRNNLKPEEKLQMTEEEKRERLKEMQNNAKEIAEERLKEFQDDYQDKNYNNDESNIKHLHNKQNNPKFLQQMNKELYTGSKDVNSLAQQLSKNKTRLARNLDDKNTFKS